MELTVDRVFEALTFAPDTGKFYWIKPSKYHSEKTLSEAGCAQRNHNGKNYWVIRFDGRAIKRGRLVFFVLNGRWPTPCLDHINGDSLDDRPENLREATIAENAWNHKKRARRIALPMGVRLAGSGRFQARIAHENRQIHLGCYDTPEEARAVYLAKRKELYREFA
jgi:hypothetical protein